MHVLGGLATTSMFQKLMEMMELQIPQLSRKQLTEGKSANIWSL